MKSVTLQWLDDDPCKNQRTLSYIFNQMVCGLTTMLSSSPVPEVAQSILTAGDFAVCTHIADRCSLWGGLPTQQ